MPSLDGYSLNQKIDQTYDEVKADILQLQKDFHRLYQMLGDMKGKPKKESNEKAKEKASKKASKSAKVSEVAK